VIDAPPYRNSSAGVRVLHRLCHLLNQLGEDAALTTEVLHSPWNTKSSARIGPETVVIYPESVSGNPLGASRVVRYFVLSRAGAVSAGGPYTSSDLVVYLDDWLRESASISAREILPISHRLFISVLEPDIFFPRTGVRIVDCVYVGKAGERAKRFPQHAPFWRYQITERRPTSRDGLATLLRCTRTLYSYDRTSALPFEASICGAHVRVVTDSGGLETSTPWETHALVREWWDQGLENVRRFVRIVHERWHDRDARPFKA
jgi:hypothetical protein